MVRVLIVDDDEDDRDLLCEAIHKVDASVSCILARNGGEALTGLRRSEVPKPNLIFLDLSMPRVNGLQFLGEIKSDESLKKIPVIIYSTSRLVEDEQECKRLGADHFLTKPRTFSGICWMVSEVFAKEMIMKNR